MARIAASPRTRAAYQPNNRSSAARGSPTRRTRSLERKRRRRQTHRACNARRKLHQVHQAPPQPARSLFDALDGPFTRPTFLRFVVLALVVILTLGSRASCNFLRTLGALAPGHPSRYHRVFSRRSWSSWRLARGLAG